MSNIQVPLELLSKVAEFAKVAAEETSAQAKTIAGLKAANGAQKQASAPAAPAPSIPATEAKKLAEQLYAGKLISKENIEKTAAVLTNPVKLAEALRATLTHYADAQAKQVESLGTVETVKKAQVKTASALEEASKKFATSIGVH